MPVSRPEDFPVGGGGRWQPCGQAGFKSVHWGALDLGPTVPDLRNDSVVTVGESIVVDR